ncbi:RluA family pseudouridine synthase [Virgibacillus litoralis]|uniref:Pseudouridine synthase n=1 Tax=Virgibacillus litoralis TaxID=578221 RepID=A0ABS4H9V9_9BACI|nr:23S rRNA pseudouridine1911/1915/1917 synthase [Virgibacillus litoralis]
MLKWIIENEHQGLIIREYLQRIQAFSRNVIKAIVHDGGEISVNGSPKTVRYQLEVGDTLSVTFPKEKKGPFMIPEEIPLSIVYEDEDVLIINKQPHTATIPSNIHPSGTIANGVLFYYENHDIPYTVHIVTRLDRDTSGLLLIAKHRYSHSIMAASQKAGRINRRYHTIVEGHLQNKKGTIEAPIGRKEGSIIERTVTATGKPAITHYSVVEESLTHSLLDVHLETGRTHQIRVHFSDLGYPIAGDDLYGASTQSISRQALHCYQLSFMHPLRKERMNFTIPTAHDMAELIHSK